MLGTILLVLLIFVALGALPSWPYSAGWGYYPIGGAGILLVLVIVLLVSIAFGNSTIRVVKIDQALICERLGAPSAAGA